jgi:hypothetical protein
MSHLGKALLLATLALTIAGCAPPIKYDTPRSGETKMEAPFYITFSPKGIPVVLASDGNPVEPMGVEAKIPTPSAIKRASQITALEIHGSHYYLLYIAGQFYKIPLPHN